jgi:hypothetical protein
VLLVLAGVAVLGLAVTASHPYRTLAPVPRSDAAAQSANRKLLEIAASGVAARATGRPTPFRVAFSDEELTSMLAARMPGDVFSDVVVRARTGSVIEGTTTAHLGPLATPIYFQATVVAEDGHPTFEVLETKAGQLGVPGIFDGLVASALQGVPLANRLVTVRDVSLVTAPGESTIAGTAIP